MSATNPKANPFMVTSNSAFGRSLSEASKSASYISPAENEAAQSQSAQTEEKSGPDLSFLYSRESDRLGEGTSFSDSALSEVFRLKESDSMSKRRKNSIFVKQQFGGGPSAEAASASKTVSKEQADELLRNYNHNPKEQNPLYSTTANEYGLKPLSESTITTERHGLSQKFSQSFNRTMFRDEGLNASMTKSNIHDLLTPQFV